MKSYVMGFHGIIEHTGKVSFYDSEQLEALLVRAAEAAEAKVLNTHFHDFGDGMGKTGVVLLAESHISIHSWPENNYAAIDIFVCNSREACEAAIEVIKSEDDSAINQTQIIERTL
jgi:S-adenosylmethionine decarboxylase